MYQKHLLMTLQGGFWIYLRPRFCGGPQDAIEPVNRKKN